MNNKSFHENRSHGSSVFPLQVYSHHDKDGLYFVSQHWHEEIEFIYVETGTLSVTIHGHTHTLCPEQFCFINSGELHEIKSTGESLHHAIVFQPNLLDFALYDAGQHNFIRPVTSQKLLFPSLCPHIDSILSTKILTYMKEIVALYHTLPLCAVLNIKLNLLHIIESLFQAHAFCANTLTEQDINSLDRLKKIIEYIHENYMYHISLQTLSDMCFMSPNYFCQYFRKETGKSPVTFINEYRIEKAASLLADTNTPVSYIASSVGFDNFSYFIRKFREYKGVTPKTYRNIIDNT